MSSRVRILGIAGSLRRGSYNQAALRAAKLLVPENSEIDLSLMIFRWIPQFSRAERIKELARGPNCYSFQQISF
jgi:NAD(P)H-dependent FMN reductase